MQKHPRIPSALPAVGAALLIGARLGVRSTAGSGSSMLVLGESLSTDERKDRAASLGTL